MQAFRVHALCLIIDEDLDAYCYMILLLIHSFFFVKWMVFLEEPLYLSFGWVLEWPLEAYLLDHPSFQSYGLVHLLNKYLNQLSTYFVLWTLSTWCARMVCMSRDAGYYMMMLSLLVTFSLFLLLLSWMNGLLGWYIDGLHDGVESLAFSHILQLMFMLFLG